MAVSRAKNEERYSKKLYGGPGLFCSEIALFMLYILWVRCPTEKAEF